MKYTPSQIPLEDLVLDPLNPRFVNIPNPDEEGIKEYLIEYEEVLTIAKGINEEEGLMPGERIIVYKENGKYIVLEGNRRICACKLLSGILTTNGKLPIVKQTTINNISKINVDLVDSRESIQSTLYRRHIKGIRSWPTQAKLYFFARRFQLGESIDYISSDTNSTKREVKESIQKHNLLQYTLNLPIWTSAEKESINQVELEVDKFLRVFSSVSPKYKKNARQILQMTYDNKDYMPNSELDKDTFEKGLYFLAKSAFITNELTTRKHVEAVPEFVELYKRLIELGSYTGTNTVQSTDSGANPDSSSSTSSGANTDPSTNTTSGSSTGTNSNTTSGSSTGSKSNTASGSSTGTNSNTTSGFSTGTNSNTTSGSSTGSNSNTTSGASTRGTSPSVPIFFSALSWNALQSTDPQDHGLINLASELKRLSEYIPGRKEAFYERFPYAATIIMRSLFEQSLKFYIRKMGRWSDLLDHIDKKIWNITKRYRSLIKQDHSFYTFW
ncbi:hypothetical protein L5D93_15395 [Paenibacillus thiaminolyticus]|nr:hypothetical protein [Paenibacillus thiaminolyticus]